jgi:hypothetical protein
VRASTACISSTEEIFFAASKDPSSVIGLKNNSDDMSPLISL